MMRHLARVGLAAALTSQLAGCGPEIKAVALRGYVLLPAAPGVTAPALGGGKLHVTDLNGKLGTEAPLTDASGSFAFDLRTDNLAQSSQIMRLQYLHPQRGGVLLQRDVRIARGQTGAIEAPLTSLSTLAALAYEAAIQLAPSRVSTDPAGVESMLTAGGSRDLLLASFLARYQAYMGGGATAPGQDADLAQDAMEQAYP